MSDSVISNHAESELSRDVRFRNAHAVGAVIIQCFMLLSAFLVIFGLLYVCLLSVAIVIHHFFYDKEGKHIPDYVKRSMQFDSDSDSDSDNGRDDRSAFIEMGDDSTDDEDNVKEKRNRESINLSQTVRKAAQLDKFMKQDIDVNRKK